MKIRTCNHRLPTETGRWSNTDRNLRICTMCDRKSIRDEYHYIKECTYFSNERTILSTSGFHKNHNTFKFNELMNSGNIETLKSLSRLIKKILNSVCSSWPYFARHLHVLCIYFSSFCICCILFLLFFDLHL